MLKKFFIILISILLMIGMCGNVNATEENTDEEKNQEMFVAEKIYNNHKYRIYEKSLSWEDAEKYCESQGGYLVTITSKEEQDVVADLIDQKTDYNKVRFWIGATDIYLEDEWHWVTEEKWEYSNWGANEPDDYNSNQDYVLTSNFSLPRYGIEKYQWDDIDSSSINDYTTYLICEIGTYNIDYFAKVQAKKTQEIEKEELTATVSYDPTTITTGNVVTTIKTNKKVNKVDGWTLSDDGKTLTKTYSTNATETVHLVDLDGMTKDVEVKITNITSATSKQDNEKDTTTAKGTLPQTGVNRAVSIASIIAVILVALVLYKKYNSYKDIK